MDSNFKKRNIEEVDERCWNFAKKHKINFKIVIYVTIVVIG